MKPRRFAASFVLFSAVTLARAESLASLQASVDGGKPSDALERLRPLFAKEPENPRIAYNYALASYASGNYTAALEVFSRPFDGETEDLRGRRLFQLGNTRFHLAEAMASANLEGALNLLEKARESYEQARQLGSGIEGKAEANAAESVDRSVDLIEKISARLVDSGEAKARRAPEDGLPDWIGAVGWLEKARKLSRSESESSRLGAAVSKLSARIGETAVGALRQKKRQADRLVGNAPERALALYEEGLALLASVLPTQQAGGELAKVKETFEQGLREARLGFARVLAKRSQEQLASVPQEALQGFLKARDLVESVLASNPADEAAKALKTALLRDLRDAYESVGDTKANQAALSHLARGDRIDALQNALVSYEAAQALETRSTVAEKTLRAHKSLSVEFTGEGEDNLAKGRELATHEESLEEAAARLEKALASFRFALRHDSENAKAREGEAAVSKLLDEVRERLGKNRKLSAEKSAESIEGARKIDKLPPDAALKLLDYRKNEATAKGPQMIQAPENKPLQDW